ncbi:MAG: glycine cleavage system aminomethyltransferase [Gammaproteobacteria bacterium]|jgi:aminomethyltransferase|nr:glycine cleavage system aminomethyltransferase [Gammaproteobacteria bacterium]
MGKRTELFAAHQEAKAKIVDFAGYDMPLHYGSQIEEHHEVRLRAGMFDVSHMLVTDLHGANVQAFLQYLLANDVAKLKPGKALYSCMLNQQGGVIDDLIVYQLTDTDYRLITNAGTREKDLAWLSQHAKDFDSKVTPRLDLSILAVQGPKARELVAQALPHALSHQAKALKPFWAVKENDWMVARTGYTGEDGFEIILPNAEVLSFWNALLMAGVKACGLGARDTLRLEAGMNLYGQDMDEQTNPLEAGLSWTVAMQDARHFIGRAALEAKLAQELTCKMVGLVLEDRGVLRSHQKVVVPNIGEGEVTSGTYSPTLNAGIALARVPVQTGEQCFVEIRGKLLGARVVSPPFVKQGKKTFI